MRPEIVEAIAKRVCQELDGTIFGQMVTEDDTETSVLVLQLTEGEVGHVDIRIVAKDMSEEGWSGGVSYFKRVHYTRTPESVSLNVMDEQMADDITIGGINVFQNGDDNLEVTVEGVAGKTIEWDYYLKQYGK